MSFVDSHAYPAFQGGRFLQTLLVGSEQKEGPGKEGSWLRDGHLMQLLLEGSCARPLTRSRASETLVGARDKTRTLVSKGRGGRDTPRGAGNSVGVRWESHCSKP